MERIGGDYVNVNVMVGPGDSPHTYEPKSEQMTALSQASAYFSIGVDFENAWMDRIAATNADMQIVDISANLENSPWLPIITKARIAAKLRRGRRSGSARMDLAGKRQNHGTKHLRNAGGHRSRHQADFQANLDSFTADIDQLEADINANLSDITSKKFIVFHPAWGYFARDFGLEQIAIEIGGSEPSAQELAGIIDEAKAENVKSDLRRRRNSAQKTAEYIANEVNGRSF